MNAKARTGGKVEAIVEFPWEIVFLQKPLVIEKRFEPQQIGRFRFWIRFVVVLFRDFGGSIPRRRPSCRG